MSINGTVAAVILVAALVVIGQFGIIAMKVADVMVASWEPVYTTILIIVFAVCAVLFCLTLFAGALMGFDAVSDLAAQLTGIVAILRMGHLPGAAAAGGSSSLVEETKRWTEIAKIRAQTDRMHQQIAMDAPAGVIAPGAAPVIENAGPTIQVWNP